MEEQEVERFSLGARSLHWAIAISGLLLGLTGLCLYVPAFGVVAQGGYTRVIHRVAAIIFILAPLIYWVWSPRSVVHFIKEAFAWGRDDWEWMKAAPDYYFGGEESKMPPQGHINGGQRLYQLVALVSGVALAVTGLIMWFGKGSVSSEAFIWLAFGHDVFFILFAAMTLLHMYLGAVHPYMTESLRSMITGVIPARFAKTHYGKWYEEIVEAQRSLERGKESRSNE